LAREILHIIARENTSKERVSTLDKPKHLEIQGFGPKTQERGRENQEHKRAQD
jgi:hypothetical protein